MTSQALVITPHEIIVLPSQNTPTVSAALVFLQTQRNPAAIRSDLNKIARLVLHIPKDESHPDDWQRVTWETMNAAYVAGVFNQIVGAPATRNRALSTLKGVARTAWTLNTLDTETLARINAVKGDSGSREAAGRNVEAWEIAALIRACADDRKRTNKAPAAIRDAAVIGLAVKTGARRAELAGIDRADMTTTSEGYEIRVIGKRNKERTLYIDTGAAKLLAAWLTITEGHTGPLFVNISQIGSIGTERLSSTALHELLLKRAEQAGLAPLGWHDFRRTFAGVLLDSGEDISTVANMMGHSSVNTTARYDRRPAEARRRAAKKISVPVF